MNILVIIVIVLITSSIQALIMMAMLVGALEYLENKKIEQDKKGCGCCGKKD